MIPTRGRRPSLLRLLQALGDQTYPASRLEVIVCLDGDIDGTAAALRGARFPTTPIVLELAEGLAPADRGAGAARNRGAAAASGEVLVFLDDDMIPAHKGALSAHAQAHAQGPPAAVVGPCLPGPSTNGSEFAETLRTWWNGQNRRILSTQPLRFTDVGSGNLSLPRAVLDEVGGFAPLPRREDWQLGFRLARAGVELRAAPEAAMVHEIDGHVGRALADRRDEGRGDFLFAAAYPEVLWELPLRRAAGTDLTGRFLHQMLSQPVPFEVLAVVGRPLLSLFERARLRKPYSTLLRLLSVGAYWSGVRASAGRDGWSNVLAAASAPARCQGRGR